MQHLMVDIQRHPDGSILIVDKGASNTRSLHSILLFQGPGVADGRESGSRPMIVGVAWTDSEGETVSGWRGKDSRVHLHKTSSAPLKASLVPTALSIALALRHGDVELGALCAIVGEGVIASIATAVALSIGCRVESGIVTDPDRCADPQVDLIIDTSGDLTLLDRALRQCRDWGRVYTLGGAQSSGGLDYYHQIHRRALSLRPVPLIPFVRREEEPIATRGLPILFSALDHIEESALQTERLEPVPDRERCWCLPRVASGCRLWLVPAQAP